MPIPYFCRVLQRNMDSIGKFQSLFLEDDKVIEGKSLGGKKVCRVNVSLTNAENQKLSKLATACNMRPTTLAHLLITRCLDDPLLVTQLQDEYGVYNAYRVVPVNHDGEIHYALGDRYDERRSF